MFLVVSPNAAVVFFIILFGYIAENSLLQYFFYMRRSSKESRDVSWKIQPDRILSLGRFWGLPLFSSKPNRGIYHRYITTFNLFMACCFGMGITELLFRGTVPMSFNDVYEYGIVKILIYVIIAVTHQCVVEYYWHRLMHLKFFYIRFHKFHHTYKSPEPWDDMYIHPVEAIGYYMILYSPPVVYHMHCVSFIIYMIIMGLCGVLDHSGVIVEIPLLYNTIDHDYHHSKNNINYSFPFPYMDIIHGTYYGTFLSIDFKKSIKQN